MKELYQFPKWSIDGVEDEGDFRFMTKEQYHKETNGLPESKYGDILIFKKEDDEDISSS